MLRKLNPRPALRLLGRSRARSALRGGPRTQRPRRSANLLAGTAATSSKADGGRGSRRSPPLLRKAPRTSHRRLRRCRRRVRSGMSMADPWPVARLPSCHMTLVRLTSRDTADGKRTSGRDIVCGHEGGVSYEQVLGGAVALWRLLAGRSMDADVDPSDYGDFSCPYCGHEWRNYGNGGLVLGMWPNCPKCGTPADPA